MSIDELKERIEALQHLQSALIGLNCQIEEVEHLCKSISIEGSHHAPIEYYRTECAVNEALHGIKDTLSRLGVRV